MRLSGQAIPVIALPMIRRLFRSIAVLIILALLFLGQGLWNATRVPLVREGRINVADWPKGSGPLRILLLSDIHVAGPDMPPARLAKIVAQINALHPDLILIAGDLVSQKPPATRIYTVAESVAPLAGLRAPLGVVAVMGNHDHWFHPEDYRPALAVGHIALLQNAAIQRGPLVIGGVDDEFSGHANIALTYAAMARLSGPRIILTHSPDIVPDLPSPVAAVFAGHTHCGQVTLPLLGQISTSSHYGPRFNCGLMTDRGQKIVVGAGVGTSNLWVRYATPPDMWLVTLGGG
jgi:predicted MPP superfamily phosphohydrolase